MAEILNGENLAVFELRASNNVDRAWGIDDAHILAEHGVNWTSGRNDLIFGRHSSDRDLVQFPRLGTR